MCLGTDTTYYIPTWHEDGKCIRITVGGQQDLGSGGATKCIHYGCLFGGTDMSKSITDMMQQKPARVAGFMFLLTMATGIFAEFIRFKYLFVPGNVAETANNIVAFDGLFRIAIVSELVTYAGVVLLASSLYVLLKPVNKNLAQLALFWRLGEVSVMSAVLLTNIFVLVLLSGAEYLTVFATDQLQALVKLFLAARFSGYWIGLVFFGLGSTVFNYLWFKSNKIPRLLAVFGIFSSLVVMIISFAALLYPHQAAMLRLGFLPMFIDEVVLGFWLLIKGINVQ